MQSMKRIILLVIAVLLISGGGYYFINKKKMASPLPSKPDIKVIFDNKIKDKKVLVMPTETAEASPTAKEKENADKEATPAVKVTVKPTVKPTVKLSPTGNKE